MAIVSIDINKNQQASIPVSQIIELIVLKADERKMDR